MSRNPITSNQYQDWIHCQLEPEDIVIRGNGKRYKPVRINNDEFLREYAKNNKELTEAEKDKLNDDYLKLYGL